MVTEVNAGFEQLAHRKDRYCHSLSCFRLSRRRRDRRLLVIGADTGARRHSYAPRDPA